MVASGRCDPPWVTLAESDLVPPENKRCPSTTFGQMKLGC